MLCFRTLNRTPIMLRFHSTKLARSRAPFQLNATTELICNKPTSSLRSSYRLRRAKSRGTASTRTVGIAIALARDELLALSIPYVRGPRGVIGCTTCNGSGSGRCRSGGRGSSGGRITSSGAGGDKAASSLRSSNGFSRAES